MTRLVLREPGLVVIDDVLPPSGFQGIGREIAGGDYRSVHAQRWDKAWRLWDGAPMRGESVTFDPGRAFASKGPSYPTATSVDLLIDAVRAMAAEHHDVAGREGADWIALFLAPWLYPPGSALSQHRDEGPYAGSFTYFAHARWQRHWGGELLVAAPTPGPAPRDIDPTWLSLDGEADDDATGIATAILPRPNRLVLLGPDRPHRIARVDATAGGNVRSSIAGFFLRPPTGGH